MFIFITVTTGTLPDPDGSYDEKDFNDRYGIVDDYAYLDDDNVNTAAVASRTDPATNTALVLVPMMELESESESESKQSYEDPRRRLHEFYRQNGYDDIQRSEIYDLFALYPGRGEVLLQLKMALHN